MALLDRCVFTPVSAGLADFTVSAAVPGYRTPAQAGAVNGSAYSYVASSSDDSIWEIGRGVYTGGVLARTTVIGSSASGAKVNFVTQPTVAIDALVSDIVTQFSDGGVYIGTTPFDPGANNLFVQGAIFVGNQFIDPLNYGGSNTATLFQGVLGTTLVPTTNADAPFIFEKTSNCLNTGAVLNPTVLIVGYKNSFTAQTDISALVVIATDNAGGVDSWCEAGRFESFNLANGGSPYGIVASAGTGSGISYTYLIGAEGYMNNNSGTSAPVPGSFNKNSFSASFVATNATTGNTGRCDAGFVVNPFNASPFRTGLYIGLGGADHTGFYNAAALVNGIDLSTGTYSSNQILGIGCSIDAVGSFRTAGLVLMANGAGFPSGGTAGVGYLMFNAAFGIFCGSGLPTLAAGQGSIYLRTDGTINARLYINKDGSTGWTAFSTAS